MILLDTCTLLWVMANDGKLSKRAKEMIENDHGPLYLSSISAFEIGILTKKKRVMLELPFSEWIKNSIEFLAIREIPITTSIATLAADLDDIHRDPADRLIIATAIENNLTILTPDANIHRYKDVKVIW